MNSFNYELIPQFLVLHCHTFSCRSCASRAVAFFSKYFLFLQRVQKIIDMKERTPLRASVCREAKNPGSSL